ncbi:MAG TPA: antibiotic biosynthesis monooxygenase [Chthonomonadaceae bacterium]|nr:antibiotic biosynthesis monooxygenase [Chthonomonadaceae bacterium]
MFAQVSRVQLHPGYEQAALKLWQETLLPALRQQRGFRGVQVLYDSYDDLSMAIEFWESVKDAQNAHSNPVLQQAYEQAADLLLSGPDLQGYTVLIDERA